LLGRLVLLLTLVLVPLAAWAQGEEPAAAARVHFEQGMDHARAGRWIEAREAFRRAYGISPQPATLLNVAGAEAQTGQLVAAAASYRALLRVEGLSTEMREAADKAVARVEARTPRLRVVVKASRHDAIDLDGAPLDPGRVGVYLPVDPGPHSLRLRLGTQRVERSVTLQEGEARTVLLEPPVTLPPSATGATPAQGSSKRAGQKDERSSTIFSSPWFWAAAGVVVVGGTVAIVCAAACGGRDPYRGTLPSVQLP
jgi:hypothetical protein